LPLAWQLGITMLVGLLALGVVVLVLGPAALGPAALGPADAQERLSLASDLGLGAAALNFVAMLTALGCSLWRARRSFWRAWWSADDTADR